MNKAIITVAVTAIILLTMDVYAQDNYIKCKHISTGAIQMFPGMSCPWNWVPV
jgi:hypothetical protein